MSENSLLPQTLVAAFSKGADRSPFKAISLEEAELLGFEDTGRIVGVKPQKDARYNINLPLWAEPEND